MLEKIEELLNEDDITLYKKVLRRSPFGNRLTEEQVKEFVNKAIEEAILIKEDLEKLNLKNPIDYINHFKINKKYVFEKESWNYQYLGLYKHKSQTIVINNVTLDNIKEKIKKINHPKLKTNQVTNVVLMHEFFHHLEKNYPNSFTKQKHINVRILGIIPSKARLFILGEIAAIHFSKIMTNIEHSPLLYKTLYNNKI